MAVHKRDRIEGTQPKMLPNEKMAILQRQLNGFPDSSNYPLSLLISCRVIDIAFTRQNLVFKFSRNQTWTAIEINKSRSPECRKKLVKTSNDG